MELRPVAGPVDDEVLRRLMGLELGRINQGTVAQPVPLARLLANPATTATTRGGDAVRFDADAVRRLAEAAPPWLHHRLRLPITICEPHDAPGDAYVEDGASVEALEAMKVATSAARAGRLWMAAPLWRRVADRYPTCFQVLHL